MQVQRVYCQLSPAWPQEPTASRLGQAGVVLSSQAAAALAGVGAAGSRGRWGLECMQEAAPCRGSEPAVAGEGPAQRSGLVLAERQQRCPAGPPVVAEPLHGLLQPRHAEAPRHLGPGSL